VASVFDGARPKQAHTSPPVTSFGDGSSLGAWASLRVAARGAASMGLELEPRRPPCLNRYGNRPGSTSCGRAAAPQRELGPPGCRLDVAKGGLARAARSKRHPGSQGGVPRRGRGYLGGKKSPSKSAINPLRSRCTPKGIPGGAGWVLRAAPLPVFLLYAFVLPEKPAICFGVPKFPLWGPKSSAPCAKLAPCSDRTKAQQRRERHGRGCVAY
jgi:hypothetical protein